MRITQFTDFSLRLLLFLARERNRVVSIREIAEHYDISAPHLRKIVQKLAELGLIQTVRGKNGGLVLGREPADINLGALMRSLENLTLLPCFAPCAPGDRPCPIQGGCRLQVVAESSLEALLRVWDARTLADVM